MNRAFERFKELADKKKNVYDEDIEAIVAEEFCACRGGRTATSCSTERQLEHRRVPQATVKLRVDGAGEDGPRYRATAWSTPVTR